MGRRTQLPTLVGCICSALCCGWHGDNSCHWVTLEMGLKMREEAFLAPFLTIHRKNTAEFNSERGMGIWEARVEREAEAKWFLTQGRAW